LLKRLEKLFGGSKDITIITDDFEQHQHRKYKESVKEKGYKALFRKEGYNVYFVNELRTSCRCNACAGDCNTFKECENPRPYCIDSNLRHGLVKRKTCSKL